MGQCHHAILVRVDQVVSYCGVKIIIHPSSLYPAMQYETKWSGNARTWQTYLEVGPKIACDVGGVTLGEYGDFLLDVFNLILRLLQINDLHRHYLLRAVVNPGEYGGDRRRMR